MSRIGITGSRGLIGPPLSTALLDAGHEVIPIVRGPGGPGVLTWDPLTGLGPGFADAALDVVVHLAGEPIGQRWSKRVKRRIEESRTIGTWTLAQGLASMASPPQALVSASAIGFYGDRGDIEVDESSPPGSGFLPEVVQGWEQATSPARTAGIRVVTVRTGIVLTPDGGALARMLLPFRLGLGGPVAGGQQYMSWISLTDLIRVYVHVIESTTLEGPINAVAPAPVRQAEFARVLGKALHRPSFAPLPGFMVDLLFGEMGRCLVVEGARILPVRLHADGFEFSHPDLPSALRAELAV